MFDRHVYLILVTLTLAAAPIFYLKLTASDRSPSTVDLVSYSNPPFVPDPDCPKYIIQMRHAGAGIGHLFGSLVFASKMASETRAALVLDDQFWLQMHDLHGGFPYFRRLFGLHAFLSLSEFQALKANVSQVTCSNRKELYAALKACSVVCKIDSSSRSFCEGDWCFKTWPGVYAEMQPVFRSLFLRNSWPVPLQPLPCSMKYTRCVVWHLRNSDILLHENDSRFFERVYNTLTSIAKQSSVDIRIYFFFGDKGVNDSVSVNPPHQYDFLSFIPNALFVSSSRPDVDLLLFTKANVLIGTGSSFVHTAAVIAPEQLIYLEHPPKESNVVGSTPWRTYHINSSVILHYNGTIDACNQAILQQRLVSEKQQISCPVY